MDSSLIQTEEDYKNFKESYNNAILCKNYTFMFYGQEFVTYKAKYIIEFLEGQRKDKPIMPQNPTRNKR